jgi:hypothetical protein
MDTGLVAVSTFNVIAEDMINEFVPALPTAVR